MARGRRRDASAFCLMCQESEGRERESTQDGWQVGMVRLSHALARIYVCAQCVCLCAVDL